MISFASDYTTGAHPEVLRAICAINREQMSGYGTDAYSARAKEKIRAAFGCPSADVFFLVGGTQINQAVISAMLGNCDGVISADTGHINAHEAGAIEYTGHKVLALPAREGKLCAGDIRRYLQNFYRDESYEHMVRPGMVYLSFPTEYGTLYSKDELQQISAVCRDYEIPLFLDGARLSYGLQSEACDLCAADVAALCDAFTIGGTKVGALCGEAAVFPRGNAPAHFFTQIKQHGALLAKGFLLGAQFDALFTDDLYGKIGRYTNEMAKAMKEIFHRKGYRFALETPTNQQFLVLENERMKELSKKVVFSVWEPFDDAHTVVRFATGWSTTDEDLAVLENIL